MDITIQVVKSSMEAHSIYNEGTSKGVGSGRWLVFAKMPWLT